MQSTDILIIGAGAAGLFCAGIAAVNGRSVLVLDHAKKPAEKIRISGGGRCNFTNLYSGPDNFISKNPHFAKSALARFGPHDFLALVEDAGIAWHEKHSGQLFCDGKAGQITQMLLDRLQTRGATLRMETHVHEVEKTGDGFLVRTSGGDIACRALVIATGGLSIPKMGATGMGHAIARQFGLNVIEPGAALVPFRMTDVWLDEFAGLSGISVPVSVQTKDASFSGPMLFTHRGLSGPAMLQVSTYWAPGTALDIILLPDLDRNELQLSLQSARRENGRQALHTWLAQYLPAKLAACLAARMGDPRLGDMGKTRIAELVQQQLHWHVTPMGTEGYRTAEVTRGGVDTADLQSRDMQTRSIPGLYFIGEVVDVTGHLGGHNFQWAWASAAACGQALQSMEAVK